MWHSWLAGWVERPPCFFNRSDYLMNKYKNFWEWVGWGDSVRVFLSVPRSTHDSIHLHPLKRRAIGAHVSDGFQGIFIRLFNVVSMRGRRSGRKIVLFGYLSQVCHVLELKSSTRVGESGNIMWRKDEFIFYFDNLKQGNSSRMGLKFF